MGRTELKIDKNVWEIIKKPEDAETFLQFKDRTRSMFYVRKLPKKATVELEKSSINWGGFKGITKFVVQKPTVAVTVNSRKIPKPENGFLGSFAKIEPTGHIYPPQLSGLLLFSMIELGWQVKPAVWLALGQAYLKQVGNKICSLSGHLK